MTDGLGKKTPPSQRAHRTPAPQRATTEGATRRTADCRTDRRWTAAAWPVAIIVFLHRLIAVAFTPQRRTDDFSPVYYALQAFLRGEAIYDQDYSSVVPHYLYDPGATLLLSPLGAIPSEGVARLFFVGANLAAIVAALAILCRLVGRSLRGPVWPVSIALALATEAVTHTVEFGNINGILLLALVGFLWAFTRARNAHRGFQWLAGSVLGLAIIVKPQFAPLLLLPLWQLQWRPFVPALGIPLALNAVAWPLVADTDNFVHRILPYLGQTRDYANSSLPGITLYFGVPKWLEMSLWLLFTVVAVVGFVALGKLRKTEFIVWSLTASSFILLGVMFLSSLGQQYYSQWLFPLLFTVLLPRSVMHSSWSWVGAVLCLFPGAWANTLNPDWGRWATFFTGTFGWAILLCSIAGAACGWVASGWASRSRPTRGWTANRRGERMGVKSAS